VVSAFDGATDTEGRILDASQTYLALGGTRSSETSFQRMADKMEDVFPVRTDVVAVPVSRLSGA